MVDGPAPHWPRSRRSSATAAGRLPQPARTKADLLHRLRCDAEAANAYQAALALSDNAAEQEFVAERVRSTQPAS